MRNWLTMRATIYIYNYNYNILCVLRRLEGDAVGAELVDDEGDYIYI